MIYGNQPILLDSFLGTHNTLQQQQQQQTIPPTTPPPMQIQAQNQSIISPQNNQIV
jgi:hypothetical protein